MTYLDSLFRILDAEPDREVLVDADTGRTVTATEFIELVERLAEALRVSGGVSARDLVAIVAPITVEGLAVRYAAAHLGCATVYCPDADRPERLSVFLDRIDADLLIVFPETPARGVRFRHVVSVGTVAGVDVDLAAVDVAQWRRRVPTVVAASDRCVLVATGGTTGVSKASARDWQSYASMLTAEQNSSRRQLICIPLAYIAQIIADGVLTGGGTVVLQRRFSPARVLRALQDHRITHMTVVEPHLVELLDNADLDRTDLSALVAISHIGADAAASLRARLLARLPRPLLVHPYGASEIGMVSALAAPDYTLEHPRLLDSSGKPGPEVAVRIVDAEGNICGTAELGEIQVRSQAQAQGYSVALATSGFRPDGWFRTDDMGHLDDDGYLRVRGRAADMRVIAGRSVFPVDYQQAFCALPEVRYAVAVPAPAGDGFGVAFVVEPGARIEALVDAAAAHGAEHLRPVASTVVDVMPRTEQGKPDRGALTALLWP